MLSVVVIDDELMSLNLMVNLLNNFTSVQLKVVGKAMNLSDGIELIKHTNPDLVFLDIEMPDGNGMEIFNHQFSRAAALAEVVWSPKGSKNFDNFKERLKRLTKLYDILGINYCKAELK